MKRFFLAFIFILIGALGFAAVMQTGYVKTRGRLGNNGQVIPGQRLANATVVLQNNSSVVSNQSGNFSLTLPSNKFYLKNVKKTGYVVSDPDILSKQYTYSANPLVLVLDDPTAQQDDKLASERRLRRNLTRQLQQREDELEALKEEKKVTEEQYREALQKLYADQESNEKFIAEMADRYSKMDFDQLDDFQRRVAAFIQNGELVRADSLLNTKGNLEARIDEVKRLQEANAELEKTLGKSKQTAEMLRTDVGADCYNRFEICKLKFDNDSAAYWLECRAMMDTTNLNWQLETGLFMFKNHYTRKLSKRIFYAKTSSIINYFLRSELLANKQNIQSSVIDTIYSNLAQLYFSTQNWEMSLKYYQKCLSFERNLYGEDYTSLHDRYYQIGRTYYHLDNQSLAMEYAHKALELQLKHFGNKNISVARTHSLIGDIYLSLGNHSDALNQKLTALSMVENDSPACANQFCSDIKTIYHCIGDSLKEIEYDKKEVYYLNQLLEIRRNMLKDIEKAFTKEIEDKAPKFGF